VALLTHTYTVGANAFHFTRKPEQRVWVVDFDVCKKAPKLIGYDNNVYWATVKLMSVL